MPIERLAAGINFDGGGLAQSINAMQMDMDIMGIFGENVMGFDKAGYQKKEAVISSFAEYIGPNALSYSVDEQVGRLAMTKNPLDFALNEKGYFQVLNPDGSITLTRDGRFKLDKSGNLLTQDNQKVLSNTGSPVVFSKMPKELEHIKVGLDGAIGILDPDERGYVKIGTIGVVSKDGSLAQTNCVRQGFVESSNVQLDREYIEMANYKNSFDANRQMFRLQNSKLSQTISRLTQV